jgi:putative ABC transport system permease protein
VTVASRDRLLGACRGFLRLVAPLVPADRRDDWRREWDAELHWHARHATASGLELARRTAGAAMHALWWRRQQWSLDMLAQDLRYALRTLAGRPGYTIVAALTLALGIGANAAIFSVVDGVLLKPLPYREPDRLVQLWETNPQRNWTEATIAPANLLDWRARNRVFTDLAFYIGSDTRAATLTDYTLTGGADAERVAGLRVSANFFQVLGVEPLAGRAFDAAESTPGRHRVLVISHGFWQRHFAGAADVVGRTLQLNGAAFTVVGVMPRDFRFGWERPDFWAPLAYDPATLRQTRVPHFLRAVARLAPGVTLAQAQQDLSRIAAELEREYPQSNTGMGVGVGPLVEWFVGNVRRALLIFLGAVGFVLLIACANVASLTLGRAAGRTRELAIRTALGANRLRLIRQLLTESLVVSALGAVLGLGLAWWAMQGLVALAPAELPRLDEVGIDRAVLAFLAAVTVATAVAFGLAPALRSSRSPAALALKEGGGGAVGGSRRLRRALVAIEIALAVALLAGAGVMLRSFARLTAVPPGIDPGHVLTARVAAPGAKYDTGDKVVAFFEQLVERVGAMPGIASAGASTRLALQGYDWTGDLSIEGRPEVWGRELRHKEIVPGYFEAVGLPIVEGRSFERADRQSAEPVVVVNQALTRRYFTAGSAIGLRISFRRPDAQNHVWRRIVGVVADEKQDGLGEAVEPEVYQPHWQNPQNEMALVVRSSLEPAAVVPELRRALRSVDPDVALFDIRPMADIIAMSLARERFTTLLLGCFALVALALAAVGTYGVLSSAVNSRTREIGVRIALGAARRDVMTMVLAEGLWLAGIGLGAGLVLALATGRVLQSLLYETTAADPIAFAGVAIFLGLVAVLASLVPAYRALRVDPVAALRAE